MKVTHIIPIPLSKEQAAKHAIAVAESELKLKIAKVKYLGGGSFGLAFLMTDSGGNQFVIKLLRANDMMEKEVHDLSLLRANSVVKLPKVLFTRKADGTIPVDVYGMEKIEGISCIMAFKMLLISKKRRLKFADEVTEALHKIHECRNDKFGDTMNPDKAEWLDYYKPFAQEVYDCAEKMYSEGKMFKKIIVAMRAAWQKFDIIFSEKVETACLIHGDLNVGNIMVDKKYRITGFIDPLNSMYADREYDLFQFNNLTGKRFHLCESYIDKYGAGSKCAAKLAFYALWNEVFCLIKTGVLVGFIMNPLIRDMHRQLKLL